MIEKSARDKSVKTYDSRQNESLIPITMTKAAISHVKGQMAKEKNAIGIHFGVKKSGCSGWRYVLDVLSSVPEDAYNFPISDELTVYIDKKSYPFVKGTKLDYQKKGLNEIFVFENPNEASSCGCGESFNIEGLDDE